MNVWRLQLAKAETAGGAETAPPQTQHRETNTPGPAARDGRVTRPTNQAPLVAETAGWTLSPPAVQHRETNSPGPAARVLQCPVTMRLTNQAPLVAETAEWVGTDPPQTLSLPAAVQQRERNSPGPAARVLQCPVTMSLTNQAPLVAETAEWVGTDPPQNLSLPAAVQQRERNSPGPAARVLQCPVTTRLTNQDTLVGQSERKVGGWR